MVTQYLGSYIASRYIKVKIKKFQRTDLQAWILREMAATYLSFPFSPSWAFSPFFLFCPWFQLQLMYEWQRTEVEVADHRLWNKWIMTIERISRRTVDSANDRAIALTYGSRSPWCQELFTAWDTVRSESLLTKEKSILTLLTFSTHWLSPTKIYH